jgi:type IV pili sensor histidine kinase/response regulator
LVAFIVIRRDAVGSIVHHCSGSLMTMTLTMKRLFLGSLYASLLAGCASTPPETTLLVVQGREAETVPEIPVIRQGRYTLVEIRPEDAQLNLLRQVVDVRIPDPQNATVGDALRYVLLRSGYLLCPEKDIAPLDALPLPAAHYRIGPMPLDEALQMLAGSAWILDVEDTNRKVCFRHIAPDVSDVSDEAPST